MICGCIVGQGGRRSTDKRWGMPRVGNWGARMIVGGEGKVSYCQGMR